MVKRAGGVLLPLLEGPETAGLTRRSQVYKTCLKAILEGRLARGARLPSARELARDWHLARNTVDDALLQLQADGFLERRTGDGTYVAGHLPGKVAARHPVATRPPSTAGREAVATASRWARYAVHSHRERIAPKQGAFLAGLPALDHFPLELWQRLTLRRLRASGREMLGYFPSMGYEPLREATARHLATARGVACSPAQVMILNSTIQGIDLLGRVLLERDDEAWVEEPGYPNVRVALAMSGARVVPVPVDDEGLVVGAGDRRAPRAALVYASTSCQYATGVRMSLKRRIELLQWADRSGAWIVEDDYQGEFSYEGRHVESLHSLDRGERVFHIGTFTNALFPSLRLAYMVIPRPLCAVFQAARSQLDDHTHGLQQAVLADFMDGGHFNSHLRKMKPIYKARRDELVRACRALQGMGARLGPALAGMNAPLHLPRQVADRALCERAAAAGLRLAPLSRYDDGAGLNGLLLGYTALTEREIRAGVRAIGALLQSTTRS